MTRCAARPRLLYRAFLCAGRAEIAHGDTIERQDVPIGLGS